MGLTSVFLHRVRRSVAQNSRGKTKLFTPQKLGLIAADARLSVCAVR